MWWPSGEIMKNPRTTEGGLVHEDGEFKEDVEPNMDNEFNQEE